MQKIVPFLWFDNQAEEAVNFYVSVFADSRITGVTRYGKDGPGPEGSVMTMGFILNGQEFAALNGGPIFKFTEAVSFYVKCETQEEIDEKWATLSEGGQEQPCGWLKDRFGLSWQIVPPLLIEMLQDKDPKKAQSVGQALMQMKKIDIAKLKAAYEAA